MPYYYFDWTYVVLVLPCVLLSLCLLYTSPSPRDCS